MHMNKLIETANSISRDTVEFQAKQDRFAATSRDTIWTIMAAVYRLGLETKVKANTYDYDALLQSRDVKPAKAGENEWLKVIEVSCGRFVPHPTKSLTWKKNTSMAKYARALRFMESQGVTAADALGFIQSEAEHVEKGSAANRRHLNGMIAADSKANPPRRRDTTKPENIKRATRDVPQGMALPFATKKRQYVRVFGYMENGEFVPLGKVENSEGAARQDVNRLGRSLLQKEAV